MELYGRGVFALHPFVDSALTTLACCPKAFVSLRALESLRNPAWGYREVGRGTGTYYLLWGPRIREYTTILPENANAIARLPMEKSTMYV